MVRILLWSRMRIELCWVCWRLGLVGGWVVEGLVIVVVVVVGLLLRG